MTSFGGRQTDETYADKRDVRRQTRRTDGQTKWNFWSFFIFSRRTSGHFFSSTLNTWSHERDLQSNIISSGCSTILAKNTCVPKAKIIKFISHAADGKEDHVCGLESTILDKGSWVPTLRRVFCCCRIFRGSTFQNYGDYRGTSRLYMSKNNIIAILLRQLYISCCCSLPASMTSYGSTQVEDTVAAHCVWRGPRQQIKPHTSICH